MSKQLAETGLSCFNGAPLVKHNDSGDALQPCPAARSTLQPQTTMSAQKSEVASEKDRAGNQRSATRSCSDSAPPEAAYATQLGLNELEVAPHAIVKNHCIRSDTHKLRPVAPSLSFCIELRSYAGYQNAMTSNPW